MPLKTSPEPKEKPVLAPCYTRDQPGGGLSVTFQISPEDTARLKSRAGPMIMSTYIWENILKRAISSHIY